MSKVKILRICNSNLKSSNDFVYPKSGLVKCPDWKPTAECGNGLHGFLNGCGSINNAIGIDHENPHKLKFLVIEADEKDVVKINDKKCKFKKGNVIYCGGSLVKLAQYFDFYHEDFIIGRSEKEIYKYFLYSPFHPVMSSYRDNFYHIYSSPNVSCIEKNSIYVELNSTGKCNFIDCRNAWVKAPKDTIVRVVANDKMKTFKINSKQSNRIIQVTKDGQQVERNS